MLRVLLAALLLFASLASVAHDMDIQGKHAKLEVNHVVE